MSIPERNKYRCLLLTSTSLIGGTERMVLKFLSRANREKFDYHVISLLGDGSLTQRCKEMQFPAINISRSKSSLYFPLQFITVLLYCLHHRIQLIQTFGLRADVIGRLSARIAGVPVVISSIRSPDPWRRAWHIFIDDITSGNVDLFISNSEAGRQSRIKRERFPAQKIVTIHNGVDIPELPSAEERIRLRSQFTEHDDTRFIVSVIANFRQMKGHKHILEAGRLLADKIPELQFIFAGEGPLKPALLQEVEKDRVLSRTVRFVGVVEEPMELLHASDIFLLASYWEGCPTSVMEAMSACVPVIAANVGGVPEIITHNKTGILIPPKRPDAIAEAIYRLYTDSALRDRLAKAGRQHIEQHFSLDNMVRKIESIFEQLIQKKIIATESQL
ncbi:glycosyltransferase [Candidatus Sumerlaeota bacterium]|nr:glycosyltransferase [Candidatus Sumerlaeota bacterium]